MASRVRSFVLRDRVSRSLFVAAALQATFGAGNLHALPTGGQVVVPGSAQIGAPVNNALTVTNNPGAIINWQSFSIAPNELVKFVQQNAASAVLNRVTGSQMSEIMGRLQSNGRVFLVNPNGILIGPGAVIDTSAFIGSTLPMLDRDFLDGKLRFQGDASSNGTIVNQGSIRTGFGGKVLLVSPNIRNEGLIEAPGGEILLAAGKSVTITPLTGSGVSFELQAPTDSVVNIGQLIADGGAVRAFAGSLRHTGDIRANSLVVDAGGQIVLQGSSEVRLAAGSTTRADGRTGGQVQIDSAGSTRVEGSISATGSTGRGGQIEITGDHVVLTGSAAVDASGATGGGTLLVGGDWQGGSAAVRNASRSFVGAGVSLKADATEDGDGGKVVVWADGDTRFLGRLSARGGAFGGNGGVAEVSGKGELLFIGGADLSAPNGRFGSLLLDPLDLFIDTVGGLNPFVIDEATDFPGNAVTVSPATLDAIAGNVTLFASRDLRFNSNVTLTGAGLSLTAQAGRDLQLGSTLTTNNGAVSLIAGRAITTFGSPSIAAGTGAVSASSAAGSLTLGAVASAGSITATSTGGGLNTSALTATGPVSLTSTGGSISTGNVTTTGAIGLTSSSSISTGTGTLTSGGGAVNLNAPGSISTSGITTNGGGVNAQSTGNSVSLGLVSTIAGSGPTGGALFANAGGSLASLSTWTGGNGNATLTGVTVVTGTLNTTGSVALTATAGSIIASVNNAASVTAASNRSFGNTSVSLSSTTVLNATSVTATATSCFSSISCPGASISLSGDLGVNVGTVTATAPVTTNVSAPFNASSESVSITSSAGPIRAMSAASQVSATDVTLSTNPLSGGGIGTTALPLKVDVDRSFTFRPNGDSAVQLVGSGPNRFTFQPGVAPSATTYSGTISGLVNASFSATDTTVTVASFSATGGFNDLVFNQSPFINLLTNGDLIVTSMTVPAGDQTGRVPPFSCCNVIQGLPVTVQASGALTVSNYTRTAGALAKATTFNAIGGTLTLGTINGDRDSITASGRDTVTVNNLSTAGNVSVTSSPSATAFGNVILDRINSSAGSVSVTGTSGTISALNDGSAVEITAGTSASLSAASIGTSGFGRPLDIAASSVSLTANGSAAGTGYIGSGSSPTNPVVASTSQLTINATRQFNVDTGAVPLVNLTVTATPSGVTNGGTARVVSGAGPDQRNYVFGTDGSKFTLGNLSTATQFISGTLFFTTTAGNIEFGNIDFSPTNGNLTLRTNQNGTGDITHTPGPFSLGTGRLNLQADRNLSLSDMTIGGLSVSSVNGSFPGPGACETIGGSFVCAPNTLTVGNITGNASGSYSATTRRVINLGNISAAGTVNFNAYSGGIGTGTLGSSATPVNNLTLSTNSTSAGGAIGTGAIEANALNLQAGASSGITTGTINATAAASGSNIYMQAVGAINTGSINSASATPSSVTLYSNTSVSAGTVQASDLNVSRLSGATNPTVSIGAVGGIRPGRYVGVQGGATTIGPITLDGALASRQVFLDASGDLTLSGGGNILAGDGASVLLSSNNNGPLSFGRIDTGATGNVSITTPNGIIQTTLAAASGGIAAQRVTLNATGASGAIGGPAGDGSRLTLRGTTDLTLDVGSDLRLNLVDAAGGTPAPELTNLDITRRTNTGVWVFNGLPGTQTLSVTDVASTTSIAFNSASSAGAVDFRFVNEATGGITSVSNIATNGGSVRVGSQNNDLLVSSIDARSGGNGGNSITLTAGNDIKATGDVEAGTGGISLDAGLEARTPGAGRYLSTGAVTVTAGTGIGQSAERFQVTAPQVSLDGGQVFADLTGGTDLTLTAINDLSVSSTTALNGLILRIDATGTGGNPVITAPTQTFGLQRSAGELRVTGVASPTPLSSLTLATSNGDLRVIGSGASSIDASALTLQSAAALTLDGSTSSVVLSNADQSFSSSGASGQLSVNGRASLAATGSQVFGTSGANDIVFAASGGTITATAASQTLQAGRDIKLLGGAGAGASVSLTSTSGGQSLLAGGAVLLSAGSGTSSTVNLTSAGTSQTLTAGTDLSLLAGSGTTAGVSVISTGIGQQTLQAAGSVLLTGGGTVGGTEASIVLVSQAGGVGQRLQARGTVRLLGGVGEDSTVLVVNSGGGSQNIGDPFPCCNFYTTPNVRLDGGDGARSWAEVRNSGSGQQFVEPTASLIVAGGAGADSFVRISNTSSDEQWIGAPSYVCCSRDPVNTIAITAGTGLGAFAEITSTSAQRVTAQTSMAMSGNAAGGGYALLTGAGQDIRTASTSLLAGTGAGSDARIVSTGSSSQFLDPSSLNLIAGGSAGSSAIAEIFSGGTQTISSAGNTVITGGAGAGSVAVIEANGSQNLSFSNLAMTGGAGAGSFTQLITTGNQSLSSSVTSLQGGSGTGSSATVVSGGSQNWSFSSLALTGGSAAGATALVKAANGQSLSGSSVSLIGGTGAAGAGNDASALITNAAGNQSVTSFGNFTIRSGASYAPAGVVNNGANQSVSGSGTLLINTTAGANALDTPILTNHYAAIAQAGSGTQTVSAGTLTIDNANAPGRVGIANRGSSQTITASSALSVLASGGSGTATIDTTAGSQSITGNGGIAVKATGGSGLAQIANAGGNQTFVSTGGGLQVQANGGSGSAKVTATGAQTFASLPATGVRFVEVTTAMSTTGNAELTAGGNQTIHTTNGTVPGFSLKVASFGTGTAKIVAGGNQLIEADYPELMQGTRDGRIYIGDPAALGPAFIQGVNQDIFARAIIIRGGVTAASTAKLDASGTQTISILTPSAIPAGITVAGGAGGSASLDPTVQTIVSNGQIQVLGGSGFNAFADIFSAGPQTILVTAAPILADSILIQGGTGTNTYAAITSTNPTMQLGTSGGITLTGGTGSNADAVFGNGSGNVVTFACGSGFACAFTNLTGNPFLNTATDVGIANNGTLVPLSSILAAIASAGGGSTGFVFDFSSLLLSIQDQSNRTLEGDEEAELLFALFGRRLPLCR